MRNSGFYIYILLCKDKSYYTGHTEDIEKRFAEHQSGLGSKYTSIRLPVKLVFLENFGTRDEAWLAEQKIKGWSRKKKDILIKLGWQAFMKWNFV